MRVKLTPIEAKCYKGLMDSAKRSERLDRQCRKFGVFLERLFAPDLDCESSKELWSLGRRKFLTELFLAGAHVLTHAAGGNWGSDAGREKIMSICEALMSTTL